MTNHAGILKLNAKASKKSSLNLLRVPFQAPWVPATYDTCKMLALEARSGKGKDT